MVLYTIYNKPVEKSYRAHICSLATVYLLFSLGLCLSSPLLIAYHSKGFWLKESFYREQPEVHFKHEFVLLLHGTTTDDTLIGYTTFSNFNILIGNGLRIPNVKSFERDVDKDGRLDYLTFQIDMPISSSETIHGVEMALIFDYKLHYFSSLQMESIAYIHYDSVRQGARLTTEGDLRLVQKTPLPHKGSHKTYNVSVFTNDLLDSDRFQLENILRAYKFRNISTRFDDPYPIWKSGQTSDNTFSINATVHYPEERIFYRPGFWQMLKEAWIQYVAILLVFVYIFNKLDDFIYRHRLLNVIPRKQHNE